MTGFEGGERSALALVGGAGSVVFANISLPVQSYLTRGSLRVSPVAFNDSFPLQPSLDVGADGGFEWRFEGEGYGAFGRQSLLSDGADSKEWEFSSPGTASCVVALPEGAMVRRASLSLEAMPASTWWNTSWRNRIPIQLTELAGRNQTDFVVELLLDTRNWSLRSARNELRVTRVEAASGKETEIPIQILDEINNGSKCFEAALLFVVSGLGAGSSQTYYIYFNNPEATGPSPLYTDFHGRLIRNRLSGQTVERSIMEDLFLPWGCSVDRWGNLWVADRIQAAVFGYTGTLGTPGSPGNDASHFSLCQDVAVRSDGYIVVADRGNFRVCVFKPDRTLAFILGVTGVPGNDDQHFQSPSGVATDEEGNIYVSDGALHRVQVFDKNGNWLRTLGSPGNPGTGNMQFNMPSGLFVTPSRDILVADTGNHRVLALKHIGGANYVYNYTLGFTGVAGSDIEHFNAPQDVCMDLSGNTYVADTLNSRVQKFTGTVYKATIGVTGQPGFDNEHLCYPSSVSVSPTGEIFVCDPPGGTFIKGRVQVYDSSLRHILSIGARHWSGLVTPGNSDYAFNQPCGVASNSTGALFVSDTKNQRVQVYTPLGARVQTLGTTGVIGSDPLHLDHPRGLDVAPDGRVFVADCGVWVFPEFHSNHRVQVYNDLSDGAADATIGVTGVGSNDMHHLNQPSDVSIGPGGRTAIADKGFWTTTYPATCYGQRVQILSDLNDFVIDMTYGVPGTPGCSTTLLNMPMGVGVSPSGAVYVADTGNHRVVVFKNDGDNQADLIINPSGAMGSSNNQFNTPIDIDSDLDGNILVADKGNHRIQVFKANGDFIRTIGETGVNLSDAFHLNSPSGVHVADDGKILIADTGNNRVLRITPASLMLGVEEPLFVPENLSLELGGLECWSRHGAAVGRFDVDLTEALATALSGLTGSPDAYGNRMVRVQLNLSNDGLGRVVLNSLVIEYDVSVEPPNLSQALRDYLTTHATEADANGNVKVPLLFSAASAGGVRVWDLNISGDFPPVLLSPVPDLMMDEDTRAPSLCNLSNYFADDLDPSLNYVLMSASNSSIAHVELSIDGLLSVDCTVPSALNWYGWIELQAQAYDSRGFTVASNPFRVNVRPVNDAPVIESFPADLNATAGEEWSYLIISSDVDDDDLTLSLVTKPTGMVLEPQTGWVHWTPAASQLGENEVVICVSDGELYDEQAFVINVSAASGPNRPPRILSTPVTVAEAGKRYEYRLRATDDDGDVLTFTLEKSPEGMTIDSIGVIEWVPGVRDIGVHEVVVRVSDGKSSVTQEFNITVAENITSILPTIVILEPKPGAKLRGSVLVRGTASARVGTVELVEVRVDSWGWEPAQGRSSWSFELNTTKLADGRHVLHARVRDTEGHFAETSLSFVVANAVAPPPAALPEGLLLWLAILLLASAAAMATAYLAARRRRPAGPAPPPAQPGGPTAPAPTAPGGLAPAAAQAAPTPGPPQARAAPAPTAPAQKPVDSVFLIYHDGRLITYFSRVDSAELDDTLDMIRKFVKASFSGELGRLDSMQYENKNIIMERGNMMYMVVVTPLREFDQLRREMRRLLNAIDEKYRVLFKIWDGDFTKVKDVKRMVERFAGEEVWEDEGGAAWHEEAPREHKPHRKSSEVPAARAAPGPTAPSRPEGAGPSSPPPPSRPRETAPEGEGEVEAPPPAEENGAAQKAPAGEAALEKPEPKEEEEAPAGEETAAPPKKTLSREEKLQLLEDRFLLGEISEESYREMKAKLMKR
ncbi:MAG: putative Ig domain-containing protein [Thermoplasmata archaeon]